MAAAVRSIAVVVACSLAYVVALMVALGAPLTGAVFGWALLLGGVGGLGVALWQRWRRGRVDSASPFAQAIARTPNCILLLGADFRIVDANAALADMLGYDAADLCGRHLDDITHPDDIAASHEHLKALQSAGTAELAGQSAGTTARRYEKRYLHCDGRPVPVAVQVQRLHQGERGEACCVEYITALSSGSDGEAAQPATSEVEGAPLLADYGLDMISRHDARGGFTFASAAAVALLRRTPDELIGMSLFELVHADDLRTVRADFTALAEDPAIREITCECRLRTAAGGYVWCETRLRHVAVGEQPAEFVAVTRDIASRKVIEHSLRESEEKYRTLFEAAGAAVLLEDGRIVDCNAEAQRYWQRDRAALLASRPGELSPEFQPDGRRSLEAAEAYMQRALAGEPQRFHWRHVAPGGEPIDGEVALSVLQFGDRPRLFATMHNVGVWRRSEAALRESQGFLQNVLDAMDAHVAVIDDAGRVVMVNRAWTEFARQNDGDPRRCNLGADYLGVCDGADGASSEGAGAVAAAVRAALRGESGLPYIEYPCHSPVEERWFELRVSRLINNDLRGAILSHVNVTERHLAERQRRATEAQLRAVFEDAPLGIEVFDADARLVRANRACLEMLGAATETDLQGLALGADMNVPEEVLAQAWRGETVRYSGRLQFSLVRERGFYPTRRDDAIDLDVVITPLNGSHDLAQRVTGFLVLLDDVTEARRLQSELLQSQKLEAIGQLAGGIAHDFNNILTSILGNISVIEDELRTDVPNRGQTIGSLQAVEHAAQRAAKLTRQLLTFSRRQSVRPEVLDLNAVVQDSHSLLRRLISERIGLELRLGAGPCQVYADAGQLEQVLVNLVVNARDAISGSGKIEIETGRQALAAGEVSEALGLAAGEYVVLTVRDDGAGMDAETRRRAFEPFFTTKGLERGSGLGLPTVYGIVKQARGSVEVDSALGRGTTVRVYLPRRATPSGPVGAAPLSAHALRGTETILLCEDDEHVLQLTKALLQGAGYQVLATGRGADAVELARQRETPADLLVTDVIMPHMNGREVAEAIRRLWPGIVTLYISGYPADVLGDELPAEGSVHLLSKPFSRADLLSRVRTLLDHKQQPRSEA